MIKKVKKDLANAEKEKAKLVAKRNEIDKEIEELSQRIKTFQGFISQHNKMETSINEYLNSLSKTKLNDDTGSVL